MFLPEFCTLFAAFRLQGLPLKATMIAGPVCALVIYFYAIYTAGGIVLAPIYVSPVDPAFERIARNLLLPYLGAGFILNMSESPIHSSPEPPAA
jgi:hypothetical protein